VIEGFERFDLAHFLKDLPTEVLIKKKSGYLTNADLFLYNIDLIDV
jgi:hypothetical protein